MNKWNTQLKSYGKQQCVNASHLWPCSSLPRQNSGWMWIKFFRIHSKSRMLSPTVSWIKHRWGNLPTDANIQISNRIPTEHCKFPTQKITGAINFNSDPKHPQPQVQNFAFPDKKISNKNIFRQFSDSPKFTEGNCPPPVLATTPKALNEVQPKTNRLRTYRKVSAVVCTAPASKSISLMSASTLRRLPALNTASSTTAITYVNLWWFMQMHLSNFWQQLTMYSLTQHSFSVTLL